MRNPLRANGLRLKGVVVAVYVYDSDNATNTLDDGTTANGVYCDVLCYGRHEGVIPRVLVTYDRQGLHEGEISLPRATTMAVNDQFDIAKTNPASMDGDHVIIGFSEDDLKQPYIVGFVPHPSADVGNDTRLIGHRMRIQQADGNPRFWKHRGIFWGVTDDGNAMLDLTRANTGAYHGDGSEPDPPVDGSVGNYTIRLPQAATLTLEITKGAQQGDGTDDPSSSTTLVLENNKITLMNEGGAGVLIQDKDGNAVLTLGDGAVHSAIAEHLQTLWTNLVTWLSAATVLTALGPSAPFPTLAGPPPAWDPSIQSGKLSFPDG
jgi:hypothetical protein